MADADGHVQVRWVDGAGRELPGVVHVGELALAGWALPIVGDFVRRSLTHTEVPPALRGPAWRPDCSVGGSA